MRQKECFPQVWRTVENFHMVGWSLGEIREQWRKRRAMAVLKDPEEVRDECSLLWTLCCLCDWLKCLLTMWCLMCLKWMLLVVEVAQDVQDDAQVLLRLLIG